MSNENPTLETTPETTTKFQQTKTKVAEFVKRNKKNIYLTAGSTASLVIGAVVLSALKKDDETDDHFALEFNDEGRALTVTDPDSGDRWHYAELEPAGETEEDETVSEEPITESTE